MNTSIKKNIVCYEDNSSGIHIYIQIHPPIGKHRNYKSWEIWCWEEDGKTWMSTAFRGYNDLPKTIEAKQVD